VGFVGAERSRKSKRRVECDLSGGYVIMYVHGDNYNQASILK
jgi:hypothetical protein